VTPLYWLPQHPDASGALKQIKSLPLGPEQQLSALRQLTRHDLDFVQIGQIDRRLREIQKKLHGIPAGWTILKLAILASSTIDHLLPSIRAAALRWGILLDCYIGPYNQYRQELLTPTSDLFAFKPDVVLLLIDAQEASVSFAPSFSREDAQRFVQSRLEEWIRYWTIVKDQLGAVLVQQTLVEPPVSIYGHFDNAVPGGPAYLFKELNHALRQQAGRHKTLLFDLETLASYVGKKAWCDFPLWHHAKQIVSPLLGPLYGDSLARILASVRGRTAKCLVLDLDNTLWGGVIGDDGLEGIELGQGSGVGEAYAAFQRYVKDLKSRGIILAICSKNEEINGLMPFNEHSEMLLKREDFAAIQINWDTKAANVEKIARQLKIGLDSIVFFDDNPAERAIVRQFLPDVWVPEVPEDPALYVSCLSDAGYFEASAFTSEDNERTSQYQANIQREALQGKSHDLGTFLKNLHMEMDISPFDSVGLSRITQLINKSNQFNLTTRRYTEAQVLHIEKDPSWVTMQVRLKDNCGDNGMISVVMAKPYEGDPGTLWIDTWLMSCRVLGRQVESAVLNSLVEQALQRGFTKLKGEYIPTPKNGLVRLHYSSLGFKPSDTVSGSTFWDLDLKTFERLPTHITVHSKGKVLR